MRVGSVWLDSRNYPVPPCVLLRTTYLFVCGHRDGEATKLESRAAIVSQRIPQPDTASLARRCPVPLDRQLGANRLASGRPLTRWQRLQRRCRAPFPKRGDVAPHTTSNARAQNHRAEAGSREAEVGLVTVTIMCIVAA